MTITPTTIVLKLTGEVLEDAAEICLAAVLRGAEGFTLSDFCGNDLDLIQDGMQALLAVGRAPVGSPARDHLGPQDESRGHLTYDRWQALRRSAVRHQEWYAGNDREGSEPEERATARREVKRAQRVLAVIGRDS